MLWRRAVYAFLALSSLLFYLHWQYQYWLQTPLSCERQCVLSLSQQAMGRQQLMHFFVRHSAVKSPRLASFVLRFTLPQWRNGTYYFVPGDQVATVLHVVKVGPPKQRRITFPEGWTLSQLLKAVAAAPGLQHSLAATPRASLMQSLGLKKGPAEGLFFPDTYFYHYQSSDRDLLRLAYRTMQRILQKEWQSRVKGLPYRSAYEALIAASLIERETHISNERQRVAEVIINRLRRGMRLQIDASVVYGLALPYGTRVTYRMLKQNSAYNTYRQSGLPPTPICLPSKASIHAAMHPTTGSALYYVLQPDGTHRFSRSYDQHLRGVKRYRRSQKRKQPVIRQRSACWPAASLMILQVMRETPWQVFWSDLSLYRMSQRCWAKKR